MDQPALVIDTNWVLDLCVFDDPAAVALRQSLQAGRCRWLACDGMRDEFARVLTYPAVQRRLRAIGRQESDVLVWYDRHATAVPPAPLSPWRCADPDDQRYIDLSVQHRAVLLSKDKAVLAMRTRLRAAEVTVSVCWPCKAAVSKLSFISDKDFNAQKG